MKNQKLKIKELKIKNQKSKIISIVAGLIALNLNLYAQTRIFGNYEIGLSGSAGLSALHFTTADGSKPSYSAGYAFGWDIAVFFTEHWAFRTGVNMASYHASVSFKQHETRSLIATPSGLPTGSHFYMETEYRGYEEQQEALYLRFPLTAQYRKSRFYAAAGIQAGIRANATCRIRSDKVITKGYSDYTMQYYENMHGFDNYQNIGTVSKPDLGLALSGVVETGMIWKLKNEMSLYTGVFLDYGFNDVRKGNPMKESIVYNENGAHTFNSILNSQNDGKPMTDKVQPLAVGLRLRWSLSFSN